MDNVAAAHILVVDDDPKIRLLLKRCFEQEGFTVVEAANGLEVQQGLALGSIDLITLDLNLGGEDGLTIARDIRANSDIPIIFVTGKGDLIDRVVGLEVGADDYIAKPFHLREVLARVRSVLRRAQSSAPNTVNSPKTQPNSSETYRFGDWIADFDALELRRPEGHICEMTSGEMRLLEVFVKHPRRVLSRDQLMDMLKGHDWTPNDRSLDNQIARLRKKIEDDPKKPALIKTIRGEGYSFTGDVNRL